MKKQIFPSLLGANPLTLAHTLKALDPLCPGYHIDLMDFHCVKNLGIGLDTAAAIINRAEAPYHWVHCMTDQSCDIVASLCANVKNKTPYMASIHIECEDDIGQSIRSLNELNVQIGIAIKPNTPLEQLEPHLHLIHHVLLLSVHPGHSGSPFLEDSIDRVFQLSQTRQQLQLTFRIGVDGGINESNIKTIAQAGADDFAIASGIFRTDNPAQTINKLKTLVHEQP